MSARRGLRLSFVADRLLSTLDGAVAPGAPAPERLGAAPPPLPAVARGCVRPRRTRRPPPGSDDGPPRRCRRRTDPRGRGRRAHPRCAPLRPTRNVGVRDVANVTGRPVARVRAGLDALEAALVGTGTRLRRRKNRIRVVANDTPAVRAAASALDRVKSRQHGLGRTETRFLAQALRKDIQIGPQPGQAAHRRQARQRRLRRPHRQPVRVRGRPHRPRRRHPRRASARDLAVPDHAPAKTAPWMTAGDEGAGWSTARRSVAHVRQ